MYATSIRCKVEYNKSVPSLPRMCSKGVTAVFSALKVIHIRRRQSVNLDCSLHLSPVWNTLDAT